MDKVELLQKLKALAIRGGTPAEGEAAAAKLAELMEKYNITDAELDDSVTEIYEFKCLTERDQKLLRQIVYKVLPDWNRCIYAIYRKNRRVRNIVGVECTLAQKTEIELLLDFYTDLYRREEEAFFSAFIQKHRLFGDYIERDQPPLSLEELAKLEAMMNSMDDESPTLRLDA